MFIAYYLVCSILLMTKSDCFLRLIQIIKSKILVNFLYSVTLKSTGLSCF